MCKWVEKWKRHRDSESLRSSLTRRSDRPADGVQQSPVSPADPGSPAHSTVKLSPSDDRCHRAIAMATRTTSTGRWRGGRHHAGADLEPTWVTVNNTKRGEDELQAN
ncbi:hypothetical protein DPEC_G00291620 [Dallia pectoralis]|uniref:Uncharacterized protein n=1 Tax=Dallia pectoralis TaxID=75939 RepID=A0ACC2FHI0_DALPE|nr:hypothetical protein DPEC_G00291620 [Dallia pectoralis]